MGLTSGKAYDKLIEVYNYPEEVAKDLCNYFDTAVLEEFIEFLEDERG